VTPHTIPVVRVAGSHREVGLQLGEYGYDQIQRSLETAWDELPGGRSKADQLELAAEYRRFTEPRLPWLIEQLDGIAAGAGIDPLENFALSIEEIWDSPLPRRAAGRCTDLVSGEASSKNGHILVGHNNDLKPAHEQDITAIEKRADGDPIVFQLGGVPWLSVGWNSAGLSLTGNELSPNDERIGISRSHQVLEMMRASSLEEMIQMAVRPDRASSYNNVLAAADGGFANVEGSATDAEVTGLDAAGHFVHTNHYICDRMLPYEGDPEYAKHSEIRLRRGRQLLRSAAPGSITVQDLRAMLSDHEEKPDSVCRHTEFGARSKTVFWCVADVTLGRIVFGRGNPCDSVEQEYVFTEWPGR
jgi:isopenicillin-N N-acyltransferase-like protein